MRRALRPNQYDEYLWSSVVPMNIHDPRSTGVTQHLRDYESRARADTSAVQDKRADTDTRGSRCELRSTGLPDTGQSDIRASGINKNI